MRVVRDEVVVDAEPEEVLLEPDGVVVGEIGHVGRVVGLQVGGEGFGVGDGEEADACGAGRPFGDAECFAETGDGVGVGGGGGGEEGEEGEEGGEEGGGLELHFAGLMLCWWEGGLKWMVEGFEEKNGSKGLRKWEKSFDLYLLGTLPPPTLVLRAEEEPRTSVSDLSRPYH